MKRSKLFLLTILVLLGLATVFKSCVKKNNPLIFTKEIISVAKGDIDCVITVNGELVSGNTHQIEVPDLLFTDLALNEIKIRYLAAEGSVVEKGEVIAKIDESVLHDLKAKNEKEISELKSSLNGMTGDTTSQLKDIKLSVETAKLELQIKEISVDQTLYDPPAVHQRMQLEYKKSQLAYENLLLNCADQRKKLIEKYKTQSERLQLLEEEVKSKKYGFSGFRNIVSPAKGIITYLSPAEGMKTRQECILTLQNRVFASIEENINLVSRCYIDEEYFSKIHMGQKIKVFTKSNNLELDAEISKIENKIETIGNRKCFMVEAMINTPEQALLLNQTTVNTIELSKLKDVLYIPKTAVTAINGFSYVLTGEGLKLKVNAREGNILYTVIDSGLTEGQQIILNAADEMTGNGN